MAFISASLIAEPPLISLSDDDSRCCSPCSTGIFFGTLNPHSNGTGIPKARTLTKDLMEFTKEESAADKLYAEIYQKNLLKFLATGGFAARKTDVEATVDEPTVPSLIDRGFFISGNSDSLIDAQGYIAGEGPAGSQLAAYGFDYDSEPNCELEFEPSIVHETPDELLLLCLSDDTTKSPLGSELNASGLRRLSRMRDLVYVSDQTTGSSAPIGEKDSNERSRDGSGKFTSMAGPPRRRSGQARNVPDTVQPVYVSSGVDYEDYTPTLSDLVTSDYLAGESCSSSEDPRSEESRPLSECPPSPTHSSDYATTRRLVRINLPSSALHNMQDDPRFDGVCHAWVRRPDFCRWGVNCDFSHEYPPALAQKYGMIAVYVKPNGKEVKNVAEFLKLEEEFVKTQWSRLDQGAKIHSPGCYVEDCRAFLANECSHGDRCWYRHPKTVIEDGKWVTKDVRKLGEHRTQDEFKMEKRIDTGDGFWGDRQRSISATGSPSSGKRPSILSDITSPSSAYKGGRPNVVPGRRMHTVTKLLTPSENSSGIGNSDSPDLYYPRSASVGARPAHTVRSHISPALPADPKPSTRWTTVFPKSSEAIVPTSSDNRKDYNYWGEEIMALDTTDYWKNPPPVNVSGLANRQQAFAVESMTYEQLFRDRSHGEDHQESHRPHGDHATPRFVMPAKPADTRKHSESRKILDRKISLAYARQEIEDKADMRREQAKTRSDISHRLEYNINDTELVNDGYDAGSSGSDWTGPLKEMLAQKCKPVRRGGAVVP